MDYLKRQPGNFGQQLVVLGTGDEQQRPAARNDGGFGGAAQQGLPLVAQQLLGLAEPGRGAGGQQEQGGKHG